MKVSVSVIICYNICYMQKKCSEGQVTFQVFAFSEFAAKFTKK